MVQRAHDHIVDRVEERTAPPRFAIDGEGQEVPRVVDGDAAMEDEVVVPLQPARPLRDQEARVVPEKAAREERHAHPVEA